MAEYAIIIPTYNEVGNVPELARRLQELLSPLDWEAIFVDDDSRDGTFEALFKLSRENPRIRFIRRIGRHGLASACVEGMLSTNASYLAVMDADLQHDETKLPEMFAALKAGEANMVVASRYLEEGGTGSWSSTRVRMSKVATWLSSKCLRVQCSDPMSGFFALNRALLDQTLPKIQARGFKLLFDLLSQRDLSLQLKELPYIFKERQAGETKLDFWVVVDFLWLLLAKAVGRLVYRRG